MAKKSAHSEEELPFAALMDVMTNVVGVLIIVLVMTGITLAQVAKKVISEMEIVTEDEFKKIEKEAKDAKAKIDPEKIKEELKKIEQALKAVPKIERPAVKVDAKLADLEAMKAKIEEARANRDKEKQQVATYLTKIEDLNKRLDSKPRYVPPPPPETMKMPNPRPMPANPKVYHIYITSNSVITSNADRTTMVKDLGNALKEFSLEEGTAGQTRVEFDSNRLQQYLAKNFYPKYKDLIFQPRRGWAPWSSDIDWVVLPNLNLPLQTPVPDQLKMGTPFYNLLKKIAAEDSQNGVVFFHVLGEMENYVRAREIADRLKLNAGWDMSDRGDDLFHIFGLANYDGVRYSRKVDPNATPPPRAAPTPDTRLIKGSAGKSLD